MDGGGALAEHLPPTHVRPRPPPADPPQQFRFRDVVEAFHQDGWWSGVVVSDLAASPDPAAAPVTIAFPITREVIPFAPSLVRPRRHYIGGSGMWVPSRAPVVDRPREYFTKHQIRVYKDGEGIEFNKYRAEYGYSWFPAKIAKVVVDKLSYIVEYYDLEEDSRLKKKKATEYLDWRFIRPAERVPCLREFTPGVGVAVEAYCDGAWSPGFVTKKYEEGKFQIKITSKKKLEKIMVANSLRLYYTWDGQKWKEDIPMLQPRKNERHGNILCSNRDDCNHGPEPSGTKRSIPNSTGEIVHNQGIISEMMDSDVQLNTDVHGASAGDSYHKLSLEELREKMALCGRRIKRVAVRSKSKGGKAHPINELKGNNEVSDNIQLEGNINFSSNDIACASSVFVEGQTTKTPDTWMSEQTNTKASSTKMVACGKLAKRKRPRDVTSTVQQTRRKKVAGPMKGSPLSEQLDKTSEDTLNTTDLSGQHLPTVPLGFESTYDGRGTIHGSVLDDEPTAVINSISQVNINADVRTNHATVQGSKRNHHTETDILSADHPIQEAGRKVDECSIRPCLQNAGSSRSTMNNSPLRCFSPSGSSVMPLPFHVSQGGQAPFIKKWLSRWQSIEETDLFKEVPQRPHFLPLLERPPDFREGEALGLVMSFADLVEDIREASIDHSMEWLEGKISSVRHLEAYRFNVQFLQSALEKLFHLKSNGSRCLEEQHKLKAQIEEKDASISQIDALLDEMDGAIAELEQKLGRLRHESQKIASNK